MKKLFVLYLLVGMAVFLSVLFSHPWGQSSEEVRKLNQLPLLFSEDFEQGADRWRLTDAQAWKIIAESGNHAFSLFQPSKYEPPVRSPRNIALIKDLCVSDFVLEAKIKSTARESEHRDLCLFFGWQDPIHFYYVHIATRADNVANSIFIVNAAPRVSIARERTTGTNWKDGYYHTVRVTRDTTEGTIEVYFDDLTRPIMVAVDRTFLAGSLGLGSFGNDTGNFDDVRVWGIKIAP
ncbi:hypothetical protein MYX75_09460 [Acidobacteria bacterium AH-259-A15]|nr:hypothetical protein [Acidobacteria bacterium AH-259-A15]